jgi:sphinganine C4-monooxygenase
MVLSGHKFCIGGKAGEDTTEFAGAAPLTAMFFWSISYIKVVSDHSGYRFPVNLTNLPGINNAEYHDVHHSPTGIRHNFSQPWFTYWDVFYGCSKDPLDGQSLPGKKAV